MNFSITSPLKIECFSSLFKDLSRFIEHVNITVNSNHFFIQSLDSSHVLLFEIVLPSTWFDVFSYPAAPVTWGVNTVFIHNVFKTIKPSDTQSLAWSLDLDTNDNLRIVIKETTETKQFTLPIVDIESDILAIPTYEPSVIFKYNSFQYSKLINNLIVFGDTVNLHIDNDKIGFETGSTSDKGKLEVNLLINTDNTENKNLLLFEIEPDTSYNATFSLRFMKEITQFCNIASAITISLNPEFPIKCSYELTEGAAVSFYLAPMMNDNDDAVAET
jgi:proliferating cell nuclear antigen